MHSITLADGTKVEGKTLAQFEAALKAYKSLLGDSGQAGTSTKAQDSHPVELPEGAISYGVLKRNKTVRGNKFPIGHPVFTAPNKSGKWYYFVVGENGRYRVAADDARKVKSTKDGQRNRFLVDSADIVVDGQAYKVRISHGLSDRGKESTVIHFIETETWLKAYDDLRKVLFDASFRPFSRKAMKRYPADTSCWWINTLLDDLAAVQTVLDNASA